MAADTIHNFSDAMTAVPLWIAFALSTKAATRRYTYGFGRVEDLAGVFVVAMIALSAIIAGYEAVMRLIRPQPIEQVGWVALAALLGFIGNEWVASRWDSRWPIRSSAWSSPSRFWRCCVRQSATYSGACSTE